MLSQILLLVLRYCWRYVASLLGAVCVCAVPMWSADAAAPASAPASVSATAVLEDASQKSPLNLRASLAWDEGPGFLILGWEPKADESGIVSLRALRADGSDALAENYTIPRSVWSTFLAGKGSLQWPGGPTVTPKAAAAVSTLPSDKTSRIGISVEIMGKGIEATVVGKHDLYLKIGVISYNVEKFWDDNPDNSAWYINNAQFDDFNKKLSNYYDVNIQKARANNVARVLRLAGLPEVVAIQEVESAENTSTLFREGSVLRTTLEGLGYRTFLIGMQESDNPVTETTAFISRMALDSTIPSVRISPNHGEFLKRKRRNKLHFAKAAMRDIQVVDVVIGKDRLRIYNNHWKANGDEAADALREVTAILLNEAIEKVVKDVPGIDIVVLGDLNVSYNDRSEPLDILGVTGDEGAILKSGTNKLYSLWYELPVESRWEGSYNGKLTTLSQMLVSGSLYDSRGFQYVDNSFLVVGQQQPSRGILLNGDGTPLRWQSRPLDGEQIPAERRVGVEEETKARKKVCSSDAERHAKFRCSASFEFFPGIGYSDHLPLVAWFHYVGDLVSETPRLTPSHTDKRYRGELPDVEVDLCSADDKTLTQMPDIRDAAVPTDASLLGTCFKVDARKSPVPLVGVGAWFNSALMLQDGTPLRLNMARSFDARPIIKGKPEEDRRGKRYSQSQKCISRDILSCRERGEDEKGRCSQPQGKLHLAVGRLGYTNGLLTLIVGDREHLVISDLPDFKRKACDWPET